MGIVLDATKWFLLAFMIVKKCRDIFLTRMFFNTKNVLKTFRLKNNPQKIQSKYVANLALL